MKNHKLVSPISMKALCCDLFEEIEIGLEALFIFKLLESFA
jgi:hypothetical protein